MLTQQKTREEARTDHGGRGVEKEAIPAHESEKHYAECLSSIVSCREKLQEQQVHRYSICFLCCLRANASKCFVLRMLIVLHLIPPKRPPRCDVVPSEHLGNDAVDYE